MQFAAARRCEPTDGRPRRLTFGRQAGWHGLFRPRYVPFWSIRCLTRHAPVRDRMVDITLGINGTLAAWPQIHGTRLHDIFVRRPRTFCFTKRSQDDSIALTVRLGTRTDAWCRSTDCCNVELSQPRGLRAAEPSPCEPSARWSTPRWTGCLQASPIPTRRSGGN